MKSAKAVRLSLPVLTASEDVTLSLANLEEQPTFVKSLSTLLSGAAAIIGIDITSWRGYQRLIGWRKATEQEQDTLLETMLRIHPLSCIVLRFQHPATNGANIGYQTMEDIYEI